MAGNLTPFDVVTTSASVTFPAVDIVIASESPTEPIVSPFAIVIPLLWISLCENVTAPVDAILIASVSDAEPILPASAMTKLLPEVMSPVVVIVSIYASFQYFASEPKSTSLSVVGLNTTTSNKIC